MKNRTLFALVGLFCLLIVSSEVSVSISRSRLVANVTTRYQPTADVMAVLAVDPANRTTLDNAIRSVIDKNADLEAIKVVRAETGRDTAAGTPEAPVSFGRTPQGVELKYPVGKGRAKSTMLVFTYSADALKREIAALRIRSYSVVLLMIVVGSIAFVLQKRKFTKPVENLKQVFADLGMFPEFERVPDRHLPELFTLLREGLERVGEEKMKVAELARSLRLEAKRVTESFSEISRNGAERARAIEESAQLVSGMDASQRDVHESTEMLAALFDENVSSVLEMRSSIGEVAASGEDLFESSELAYAAAADVSGLSREITRNMSLLAGSVDETLSTLEELDASVRAVEENVRTAAGRASDVADTVRGLGMASVREVRDGMEKIEHEVSTSAGIMDRLGSRSKDITKVLGVIREVTEQTNLLSLNAAILAAQAGEQGRAFGVVADEIASLAERTAGSTQEISAIVTAIHKDISDAIQSTERAMTRTQEGVSLVGRTEDALSGLLEHARISSDMARDIQRATTEQAQGIRHMIMAFGNIQEMSHKVGVAVSGQEQSMTPMIGHVGTVRNVVEIFRKSMQEQHEGIRVISENMQHTNEKLSQIAEATSPTKTVIPEIVRVFDQLNQSQRTMEEMLNRMNERVRALAAVSDKLSESTSRRGL